MSIIEKLTKAFVERAGEAMDRCAANCPRPPVDAVTRQTGDGYEITFTDGDGVPMRTLRIYTPSLEGDDFRSVEWQVSND